MKTLNDFFGNMEETVLNIAELSAIRGGTSGGGGSTPIDEDAIIPPGSGDDDD